MSVISRLKNKATGIRLAIKAYRTPKIFCISFQRTGTTSVGKFFILHGYPVATWAVCQKNSWTKFWFDGDYEKIFNSPDFKKSVVFEDGPWSCLDFYKVLYHRFPDSKFILFTRDSDKWFDSMKSHSAGKTLGNTYRHSRIYQREEEFDKRFGMKYSYEENAIDNLLEITEDHREHYKRIYKIRNNDILNFFNQNDSGRIVHCKLEDKDKWKKLGAFFRFDVAENLEVHENASKQA